MFIECFTFANKNYFLQNIQKILIAPLDWGMGHTTRCIPIIKELQKNNTNVVVAGNAQQIKFLKQEIKNVEYINLEGYNIKYAKSKIGLIVKIFLQIPKIIATIKKENKWLQKIIIEKNIDIVISDNRYGLYSSKIPCYFITHQTNILVPFGQKIINQINQNYINRFTACWLPDNEGTNNLSGILSSNLKIKNINKIGLLSRFNLVEKKNVPITNTILLILSGPEPQRSLLMQVILQNSMNTNYKITVVGIENNLQNKKYTNINFEGIANTNQLQNLIATHKYIICRSGYSTMMDLAILKRNAIIIPTPGQTEQEYLGEYLMQKKYHLCVLQNKFNLEVAIETFKNNTWNTYEISNSNLLQNTINKILK